MKYFSAIIIASLFFLTSCSSHDVYERKAKTLDSLTGAVNAIVTDLQKPDTVILQKALERFWHYRQFIDQSVGDTIERQEGDELKRFYESGENLESFSGNRATLLARAILVNNQLSHLTNDVKKRSLESDQLVKFVEQEKNEATILIELASQQKKLYYSAIEEFKSTLGGIEALIKKRNNGELPAIVRDPATL